MLQRKKETANIWEHKVGNNDNIANLCVYENPNVLEHGNEEVNSSSSN